VFQNTKKFNSWGRCAVGMIRRWKPSSCSITILERPTLDDIRSSFIREFRSNTKKFLHWIFVLLSINVTHSLFIFYYSSTCFGLTRPSSGVIVYSPEAGALLCQFRPMWCCQPCASHVLLLMVCLYKKCLFIFLNDALLNAYIRASNFCAIRNRKCRGKTVVFYLKVLFQYMQRRAEWG
jgi:hypothetical protein